LPVLPAIPADAAKAHPQHEKIFDSVNRLLYETLFFVHDYFSVFVCFHPVCLQLHPDN
jgi:hypothetical protein